MLPRDTGRDTRIMARPGAPCAGEARPKRGSWRGRKGQAGATLPITAFRVTFPSSAAIWLAESPASQSLQLLDAIVGPGRYRHRPLPFALRGAEQGSAAISIAEDPCGKSLTVRIPSPRRTRKARRTCTQDNRELQRNKTAARDVVPDNPNATIWRDSGEESGTSFPHVP